MSPHPDYDIDGRPFDAYAPDTDDLRTMISAIRRLVRDGGCRRLVITLADSAVPADRLITTLDGRRIPGLDEALIIDRHEQVTPWVRKER